jgi:hypothetical protein
MVTYPKLKRTRRQWGAVTGVTAKEFSGLLPACGRAEEERSPADTPMSGKPRRRKVGGGRTGGVQEPEPQVLCRLVPPKPSPRQPRLGEGGE